ncbi:MAG: LamG domain-containing protein, partial [Candidatus Marinimicrobia bacterium]|nr:LamG domain-containing protein [Candidatus Neomarinimicrobiota bacterium]
MSKFYYVISCFVILTAVQAATCNDVNACNDGSNSDYCLYVENSWACDQKTSGTCVDLQTCLDNATCGANIILPDDPAPASVKRTIKKPVKILRMNSTGQQQDTFNSGHSGFEEGIEIDFSDRNCPDDDEISLIGLDIASGVTNGDNALFVTASTGSSISSLSISGCSLDGLSGSSQRDNRTTNTTAIKTASSNVNLQNLSIINSEITNFDVGIEYLGNGIGVTHTIGGSIGNKNNFDNIDLSINYPNFDAGRGQINAQYNKWDGLGESISSYQNCSESSSSVGCLNINIGSITNAQTNSSYGVVDEPIFQSAFGPWLVDNSTNATVDNDQSLETAIAYTGVCPEFYGGHSESCWFPDMSSQDACGIYGGDNESVTFCEYEDWDGNCMSVGMRLEGSDIGCEGSCFTYSTRDCNNECGGTAFIDDCGVCAGGTTGIYANATCSGCTDPSAVDYDSNADVYGGCSYNGCTDSYASNYVSSALIDDGGCAYSSSNSSSIEFDGINDVIRIPDSNDLDLFDKGSVMFWMKPNTIDQQAYAGLVSKTHNGSNGGNSVGISYYVVWRQDLQELRASINDGTESDYVAYDNLDFLANGSWHHIGFTWDGDELRLYVDGDLVDSAEQTIEGAQSTNYNLKIGGDAHGYDGGSSDHFNGFIDDVWLLSSHIYGNDHPSSGWTNIPNYIMENGYIPSDWGLYNRIAGHWSFDQSHSSEVALDISGNLNHGAITGASFSSSGPECIDLGCGCGEPGPSGCDNQCGSTLAYDSCGVCGGDSSSCNLGCGPNQPGPSGCDNECGSNLVDDACGVCGGDGSDDVGCGCFEAGPSGCDNTCGSVAVEDECNVCGGDNSSCDEGCGPNQPGPSGCDNECDSTLEDDECGICGGSGPADNYDCDGNCVAEIDCNGDCGGSAIEDECGVCGGGGLADLVGDILVLCECNMGNDTVTFSNCNAMPSNFECSAVEPIVCDCAGTQPSGCDNECGSIAE